MNLYGLDTFRFEIVQIEMQENKRLKIETKWIQSTKAALLYNPKTPKYIFKTKPRVAQRVQIFDEVYPSIAQAARVLGKSSRNIRLKLDDDLNQNYVRLEYHRHIYFDEYAVRIEGKDFRSTAAVVEAGLAKTTRQVRDRCCRLKWKKWSLVENRSNDYPARE